MRVWRLINSGPQDAEINMVLDEAIAREVIEGRASPTLRFYAWKNPAVSVGYFQELRGIDLDFCRTAGISVVRRPTGGRAILHGKELTYSFSALYNSDFKSGSLYEIYKVLSLCFVDALRSLGLPVVMEERRRMRYGHNTLCFMSTSFSEVTLFGRKIIGSAQRRFRTGFLQQGSMPYIIDRKLLFKVFPDLKNSGAVGISGLIELLNEYDLRIPEEDVLKERIIEGFEKRFGIKFKREGSSVCPQA